MEGERSQEIQRLGRRREAPGAAESRVILVLPAVFAATGALAALTAWGLREEQTRDGPAWKM